jgi:hypothetical protein
LCHEPWVGAKDIGMSGEPAPALGFVGREIVEDDVEVVPG